MVIRIGCGMLFVLIVLIFIILSLLGKGCAIGATEKYLTLTPEQIECLDNWDKWELRLKMPYDWGGKSEAIGEPKDCSGYEAAKFSA